MRSVLITGISRGAGKAYAEKFLEQGWRVYGTSTTGQTSLTHPHLTSFALNLAIHEPMKELASRFAVDGVELDVLINNAGVNLSSAHEFPTKMIAVDILRETLEVNLMGTVALTEQFLSAGRLRGQIVNVLSGAGSFHPFLATGTPSYQVSKAALGMYTKTLASRLQETPISVWAFDPGWMRTDMGGDQAPEPPSRAAGELYRLVTSRPPTGTFWGLDGQRDW